MNRHKQFLVRTWSYLLFVTVYIALDTGTYIHPYLGLNITPWNPAPACAVVYALRKGRAAYGPIILAVLIGDLIVRVVSGGEHLIASLLAATFLAIGYLMIAEGIKLRVPHGLLTFDRTSLINWVGVAALGTLLNSLAYLGCLTILGLLPAMGWKAGLYRFWVGDTVGIIVAMPLFWILSSPAGRLNLKNVLLSKETLAYVFVGFAMLWAIIELAGEERFRFFYLLFLPVVWASSRQGMVGAIISASVLQIGLVMGGMLVELSTNRLLDFQLRALAIALIGFFVGSVIEEQRRIRLELNQSLRLAVAGEMAGALAHELNQPLTALSAYAAACQKMLELGEQGERFTRSIQGMLVESRRAASVVRHLRDFFRAGSTSLEEISLARLLSSALAPFQMLADKDGVALTVDPIPDFCVVADQMQLALVFRNLLSNALYAAKNNPKRPAEISIACEMLAGKRVMVVIRDSGQGIHPEQAEQIFEPFHSSKASGLGLGLAISRAIVEAHGGVLIGEVADHGIFKLVLPGNYLNTTEGAEN